MRSMVRAMGSAQRNPYRTPPDQPCQPKPCLPKSIDPQGLAVVRWQAATGCHRNHQQGFSRSCHRWWNAQGKRPRSLVGSRFTNHFGFSWSRQNGEISQQLCPRGEHLIPRCNQLPGPRNPEARELQQKVFRLTLRVRPMGRHSRPVLASSLGWTPLTLSSASASKSRGRT